LAAGVGLVVIRVDPGGAAEAAGLQKSDILLEIDGRKVSSIQDVRESLKGAKSAAVLRKGSRATLTKKDF
jgi:S1-C subfamily serine protease